MKKVFTIVLLIIIGLTNVYGQNNEDPVVDYESTAGRNDHLNPLLRGSSSSKDDSQKKRVENLANDVKKKTKRTNLFRHGAERQVDNLLRGEGIGYPITKELRNEYISLIENAKPNGKRLMAVYKKNGKVVEEWYDVYITHKWKTPWLNTNDVHEMWNKFPCDHKKKRFYMSENDWFRIDPNGLEKSITNEINNGLQKHAQQNMK